MEFLIGIAAGIFTGLGLGGGAVLILLLDIFFAYDQHISQAINLLCFIPSAIICIIYNFKNKNINIKRSLLILVFGIIGAIIGSIIAKNLNVFYLKKLFGIFLIIIAIYEIFNLYIHMKNKK